MSQLWFACAPGSITLADIMAKRPVYMVDELTVSIDNAGGTRPLVGTLSRAMEERADLVLVNVPLTTIHVGADGRASLVDVVGDLARMTAPADSAAVTPPYLTHDQVLASFAGKTVTRITAPTMRPDGGRVALMIQFTDGSAIMTVTDNFDAMGLPASFDRYTWRAMS